MGACRAGKTAKYQEGWPPRPPAPAEAAPCPSITAGRPPLRVGTDSLADAGTAGLTHRHSDPVLKEPHNTEHVFLGFHLNFKIKAMDYQHGVRSQTRYFDERLSDGVPLGSVASGKGARALRWDGRPGLGRRSRVPTSGLAVRLQRLRSCTDSFAAGGARVLSPCLSAV